MTEFLLSIPPPFNMIVAIVLICSVAGIFASIATQARKYACHRQELEFKQEMVDRGMTAEEIDQICRAKTDQTQV